MGMTIADNIDFLNEAKDFFEDIANNPNINETVKTYCVIESLESAIEVIRKYQKIKELMDKEVPECIHPLDRDKYKLETIRKVLEDGDGR